MASGIRRSSVMTPLLRSRPAGKRPSATPAYGACACGHKVGRRSGERAQPPPRSAPAASERDHGDGAASGTPSAPPGSGNPVSATRMPCGHRAGVPGDGGVVVVRPGDPRALHGEPTPLPARLDHRAGDVRPGLGGARHGHLDRLGPGHLPLLLPVRRRPQRPVARARHRLPAPGRDRRPAGPVGPGLLQRARGRRAVQRADEAGERDSRSRSARTCSTRSRGSSPRWAAASEPS